MTRSSTIEPAATPRRSARLRWQVLWPPAWLRALATVHMVAARTPWLRRCPTCGVRLLGWRGPAVTARARCADCRSTLGRAPWAVEAAIVVVVVALLAGPRPVLELPAYLWFAVLGVVLAVVDAAVRRLPNVLTAVWAGGTLAGLLVPALVEHRGGDWLRALLAALALTVLFAVPALLRPGSMGWGDVKAAAAVGAALGWLGWAPVYAGVLLAFLLASGYAVVLLVRRRAGRRTQLALGPFLVAGALVLIVLLPATR